MLFSFSVNSINIPQHTKKQGSKHYQCWTFKSVYNKRTKNLGTFISGNKGSQTFIILHKRRYKKKCFWANENTKSTFFGQTENLIMITNLSHWSPNTRYTITNIMIMNFSRSKVLKFITKIMITNDWSIIHYQDNGNEGFLGRVITGNDHSAHDHIHYLQRLA